MPAPLDVAALCHLDVTSRHAPSLASIRVTIAGARLRVAGGQGLLDALAFADPTTGLAAHYARKLLGRLSADVYLVRWLDSHPSRREALGLLDKAIRAFGHSHAGGWHTSSRAA